MTNHVDVQFTIEGDSFPLADEVALWVGRAIDAVDGNENAEVAVRIVDTTEMQALNHSFRDQDKSTNVLSFPAGRIEGLPDAAEMPLGDIVICADVVLAEASQQNKPVGDHWAHMVVHGTLHLLGFDHVDDADAEIMEDLERQILSGLGVADPYAQSRQET